MDLAHLKTTTTTTDPVPTDLTTTTAIREVEYLECPGAGLRIQSIPDRDQIRDQVATATTTPMLIKRR